MITQINIPEDLNKKIKIEKIILNISNIQKTVLFILNDYFKNKEGDV